MAQDPPARRRGFVLRLRLLIRNLPFSARVSKFLKTPNGNKKVRFEPDPEIYFLFEG